MGFSLFNIIESFLLLANALAILSEKFLKKCMILTIYNDSIYNYSWIT